MEEFSFNAILAKLIQKQDDHNNNNITTTTNNNNDNNDDNNNVVISTMSSSPLLTNTSTTTTAITTTTIKTSTTTSSSSSLPSSTTTLKKSKSNTSLSTALKIGTAQSHSSAESVHFVKEFIKGNINQSLYIILLRNLYWVYKTLEYNLNIYAPIEFPTLDKRELYREKALEDDLEFFMVGLDFNHHNNSNIDGGDDDDEKDVEEERDEMLQRKIPPSNATKDYIHRIEYIAKTEPLLLLSHAYTRYLGDLSGGKVLARVAKRALNLKSTTTTTTTTSNQSTSTSGCDDGLSFYHFSQIPSAKKFKDEYRYALDNLDFLSVEQIERLVAEANVAFVLNMRIFEELDVLDGVIGASVRDYNEATCYYENCIKDQLEREKNRRSNNLHEEDDEEDLNELLDLNTENEVESKCPFAKLGGPNPHALMNKNNDVDSAIRDNTRNNTSSSPSSSSSTTSLTTTRNITNNNQIESSLQETQDTNARCPWPFVFFHDPKTGMKDWQTWLVIGLFLSWSWTIVSK